MNIEIREISLKNRPEALYKISPKGTVPVLEINDIVIDESIDIMNWTFNKCPNISLNHKSQDQIDLVRENDLKFKYWLDRYKYFDRYPEYSKKYYMKQCSFYLYNYERLLSQNTYLFNDSINFADLAILPFVRQYANIDSEHFINTFKHLNVWLNNLINSKLFYSVMEKYPLWIPENQPLIVNFNKYE